MGGKHLKRLRAEKAKVKLKKKSLPKGQNITDTTFKVRKIVTVEQLKKVENEPVTSWNLPLKDLLIRLGHYNVTSKLNSLSGIKELITNYPDILKGPSLKQLITRILELLTDEEPKVRKTAIDLVEFLFNCLPAESIIPFHEILSVHLGCAMTHRNSSIQKDSLLFIDVMIKHAPEAVKLNFKSILLNFARIIKSHVYRSNSELSSIGKNLEKSRTEMLLRLNSILAEVYSTQKEELEVVRTIHVNNKNNQISMRGLTNFYKKTPDLSALFKSDGAEEGIFSEFDPEEYKEQCKLIMPLLFDSWLESGPDQKSNKSVTECLISKPVGDLLHVILKIFMLLYDKAAMSGHSNLESWFVSSYSQNFKKCFLLGFPYLPSVSSVQSDESLPSEGLPKKFSGYMMQNLTICYLAYSLKVTPNNALSGKLDNYISSALTTKNPNAVPILSKVVEAVLKSPRRLVLPAAIKAFNESSSPELRETLSKVLTVMIINNEDICQKDKDFLEWMNHLPEQLLKPCVSLHVIEGILTSVKKPAGSSLLKKIEEKSQDILDNLPNIKVEGIDQLEGQKLIADILYWCSDKILKKLQNSLSSEMDSLPPDLKTYLINIFSYKLSK